MTVGFSDEFKDEQARAGIEKALAWFKASGVDLDDLIELGRLENLGGWQTTSKVRREDGTDELVTTNQAKWNISPQWETGPSWPLIQPAPAMTVRYAKVKPSRLDGYRTLVCLPDLQAPFIDWDAVSVALQIVADIQPDTVVLLGDNLDLPTFSRFRKRPEWASTTQLSIDAMAWLCAQIRSAVGPDAEIVWLEGNHDRRLETFTLDNAAAAFGVAKARMPDEDPNRPVLTVPNLCRLDEFGVEYLEGHPARALWWQPHDSGHPVRVVHGHYTGRTAADKYLHEGATTIYGHTHHRTWLSRVLADGRELHAISPGCLCDITGSVPGTMSAHGFDGRPIRQAVNWQQGLLVAHGDGESFTPQVVPIVQGRTVYGHKPYAPDPSFAESFR